MGNHFLLEESPGTEVKQLLQQKKLGNFESPYRLTAWVPEKEYGKWHRNHTADGSEMRSGKVEIVR